MKVTVREISIASKPECTFYLKLEWAKDLGDGFVILLCDGVLAWSGEVSEEDVSREAQEMEMSRESYIHDLQLILIGDGQPDQRYRFHLASEQQGSSMLQLSYEKLHGDMSFRFGVVKLLPVPEPSKVIKDLISYGLGHSADLKAKKHNVDRENQRLRNEQEHTTAKMERYIKEKDTLEKELYNRFVMILNKKKAKIHTLQERIKQLENIVQEEKHRRNKEESCHGGNEHAEEKLDKSDYGTTTDEEGDEESKTQKQKLSNQVLASNPIDDGLNDIADVAPSRKRRQRGVQPLGLQTKRPSLEQKQTARKDQLKEADVSKVQFQQHMQDSPELPEPEDLFDDF